MAKLLFKEALSWWRFLNEDYQTFETVFPGDHSRLEPPDPISNSEVKHSRADDSVGSPHVKVGHCQDFIPKKATS